MARTANPHPESKEKLLSAAQQLMLEKGYWGTTVEDICGAAGLTKGSFFHYFKSKDDLTKAAIERFGSERMDAFCSAPCRTESDPLQRVYGNLDLIASMASNPDSPRSCLVGNITQEVAETNSELRRHCCDHFSDFVGMIQKDFEEAKTRYKPRGDIDPKSLAECLLAIIQGSLLLGKAKDDRMKTTLQNNVLHFKTYVQRLFEG
jgi:TetR/AcrR family transcriptional repressor of nem operon